MTSVAPYQSSQLPTEVYPPPLAVQHLQSNSSVPPLADWYGRLYCSRYENSDDTLGCLPPGKGELVAKFVKEQLRGSPLNRRHIVEVVKRVYGENPRVVVSALRAKEVPEGSIDKIVRYIRRLRENVQPLPLPRTSAVACKTFYPRSSRRLARSLGQTFGRECPGIQLSHAQLLGGACRLLLERVPYTTFRFFKKLAGDRGLAGACQCAKSALHSVRVRMGNFSLGKARKLSRDIRKLADLSAFRMRPALLSLLGQLQRGSIESASSRQKKDASRQLRGILTAPFGGKSVQRQQQIYECVENCSPGLNEKAKRGPCEFPEAPPEEVKGRCKDGVRELRESTQEVADMLKREALSHDVRNAHRKRKAGAGTT